METTIIYSTPDMLLATAQMARNEDGGRLGSPSNHLLLSLNPGVESDKATFWF